MSFLGPLSEGIHYSLPSHLLHQARSSTYVCQWAVVLKFVLPSVCQLSLIYLFFFFLLTSSSFIISDSLYWTRLLNWFGRTFWDPFSNTSSHGSCWAVFFFYFFSGKYFDPKAKALYPRQCPVGMSLRTCCCHLAAGVPHVACFL